MNWIEIKDKYPEAFNAYESFACGKGENLKIYLTATLLVEDPGVGAVSIHSRELYDFFDEKELYIEITFDRTMKRRFDALVFSERMEKKKYLVKNAGNYFFSSRKEAEDAAFEVAFKLLETQLQTIP